MWVTATLEEFARPGGPLGSYPGPEENDSLFHDVESGEYIAPGEYIAEAEPSRRRDVSRPRACRSAVVKR